jgi:hypothetical protein
MDFKEIVCGLDSSGRGQVVGSYKQTDELSVSIKGE